MWVPAGFGAEAWRSRERDLAFEFFADKQVYQPGETATIDLQLRPSDGSPARAALGLVAVDEAVFALYDVKPGEELGPLTQQDGFLPTEPASTSSYRKSSSSERERSDGQQALSFAAIYDPLLENERAWLLAEVTKQVPYRLVEHDAGKATESVSWEIRNQERRSNAYWSISPLLACGVLLVAMLAYGILRVIRPVVATEVTVEDRKAWKRAVRQTIGAWFASLLAPVGVLAVVVFVLEKFPLFNSYVHNYLNLSGFLLVLIGTQVWLVLQGRKAARTAVGRQVPLLRTLLRILPVFQPLAYGYVTIIIPYASGEHHLDTLFRQKEWFGVFVVMLLILVQLAWGSLTVGQNSVVGPSSALRRTWWLLSRATFGGLPVALVALALFTRGALKSDRDEHGTQQETYERGDNKEGGTGTRAKGEDGSMGNPNGRVARSYGAKGGAAQSPRDAPRVRGEFPEVLLWIPETITSAQGKATLRIPLADSITTWRLGATGLASTGHFGSASTGIRVFQDFFVDAILPAALTRGDEVTVPIALFNYLDAPQDLRIAVETSPGLRVTDGAGERTLSLRPREVSNLAIRVVANVAGEQVLRIKAVGSSLSDTVERKVRVEPGGRAVEQVFNGVLQEAASVKFALPDDAVEGSADLYLKLYRGTMAQVAEGLDGVFRTPNGCFEQTSSTTYPSILALDFLKKVNRVSPELQKKAEGYISVGYQRLLSFEVAGGGFDWYGRAPAHRVLTAYGLVQFHDLAKVFPVDEALIARTRQWLMSQQTQEGTWVEVSYHAFGGIKTGADAVAPTTAYVAWALAETGEKGKAFDKSLEYLAHCRDAEADSPYVLSLRANALLAAGRKADAEPVLAKLLSVAIRDGAGTHWGGDGMSVTYSRGVGLEEETTALAAHALFRAGGNLDVARNALDWLARRRQRNGVWSTTQATVFALRALLDDVQPGGDGDQVVKIEVNSEPAGEVKLTKLTSDIHQLVGLRKTVRKGDNIVRLDPGSGGAVLYQLVALHHVPWRDTDRAPSPLKLTVSYPAEFRGPARTGLCQVRLQWAKPEPANMVVAQIGIPPTFEPDLESLDTLVNSKVIDRYTLEPRHVTIYIRQIARGTPVAFPISLRGSRPGKVEPPATRAWPYYEPSLSVSVQPPPVRCL